LPDGSFLRWLLNLFRCCCLCYLFASHAWTCCNTSKFGLLESQVHRLRQQLLLYLFFWIFTSSYCSRQLNSSNNAAFHFFSEAALLFSTRVIGAFTNWLYPWAQWWNCILNSQGDNPCQIDSTLINLVLSFHPCPPTEIQLKFCTHLKK
jgi:hypothetical protein